MTENETKSRLGDWRHWIPKLPKKDALPPPPVIVSDLDLSKLSDKDIEALLRSLG